MRLFGLIGYPLSHSFSEKYFKKKFEKEAIRNCDYRLFPINSIEELPHLLQQHPELKGLNVTIPYKKQVLDYAYELHLPDGLQASNCINIKDHRLHAYNTDWTAFRSSISANIRSTHKRALVLGSGGASLAVCYALQSMAIGVSVVSRNRKQGIDLTYDDLDEYTIRTHTVIINTTPLGSFPDVSGCPPIPYEFIGPEHLLFDLVYNPALTVFLQKGMKQGAQIQNGSEMLVLQAEESWKIWNEL